MLANLSAPVQGVHLQKEAVVFQGPLIFVVLHIDLDQTHHAGGNIEVVFLLSGNWELFGMQRFLYIVIGQTMGAQQFTT